MIKTRWSAITPPSGVECRQVITDSGMLIVEMGGPDHRVRIARGVPLVVAP